MGVLCLAVILLGEGTWSRWETGKILPAPENFRALGRHYTVDPEWFVGGGTAPVAVAERAARYDSKKAENHQVVIDIHDLLVKFALDREFNAMVLAVLRATKRVKSKILDQLERVLIPPLGGKKKAQ